MSGVCWKTHFKSAICRKLILMKWRLIVKTFAKLVLTSMPLHLQHNFIPAKCDFAEISEGH